MPSKFTLYKHLKISGKWRYFRAAVAINNKVKPHIILIDGKEEEHKDGSYCVRNAGKWIDVATIQRKLFVPGQSSPRSQALPFPPPMSCR